jgi:prepilin-type N-terminal cleavage/methylation domain-containing protein
MKRTSKKGFTIVELLTVMGVIAVLIGLLVPALGLVKDYSKALQQRAQFHSISVGLEMFKTEFGSYPRSYDNSIIAPAPADPTAYCGANKLAEAMVGQDLIGFHPSSDFRANGTNTVIDKNGVQQPNTYVYDTAGTLPTWQTADENIQARKGPFIDLENANAFYLDEIYNTGVALAPFTTNPTTGLYPLVLCDVYAKKRGGVGAKKAGSPILYFRARTNYVQQDETDGIDNDIYYYPDNENLLMRGNPETQQAYTLLNGVGGTPEQKFENMIINEQVQTIRRPYRSDTYILISAGKDGDFGTADDIFNFEKGMTE